MNTTLEEKTRSLEKSLLAHLTEREGLSPAGAEAVLEDAWKRAADLCCAAEPQPVNEAMLYGLLEALHEYRSAKKE